MSSHVNHQKDIDRALFDRIAVEYGKKDILASSRLARRYQLERAVKPILKERKNLGTLIDLGCGIGAPAKYLSGKYEKYIGLDYSEKMVEAGKIFHSGNTKVDFFPQDVTNIQLPENSADVVLGVGILHHIPMAELDKTLQSARTVVKSGGFLVFIEPQRGNPLIQATRWLRSRVDASYSSDQHFFSKKELADLLDRNGFTDYQLEFQGFFSKPLAQVALRPQWLATPISWKMVMIDKVLDRFLPWPLRLLSWDIIVRARVFK
ncbi:MAG: methyltransferase domain-containing protein [Candidatus Harrisonbacteria bacterium]|nr:methyltransferase domain-containing protein [Candidatus Harrisonbacteria bacterium]